MKGIVFNIQKFSVNDGPGIRTTVFLKGCPLNCIWCHNPESKSRNIEIMYHEKKCVLCSACVDACHLDCHRIENSVHIFRRDRCISCRRCVGVCGYGALETVGREMTAEEVILEVKKDKIFYETSGGGLTLSGGEPTAQLDFALEILKLAKEAKISTAVETAGCTSEAVIKKVAEYTDLFLFDYKLSDSEKHEKYVGIPNEPIIRNLEVLDSLGKDIVLRCPIIPGINDDDVHFNSITALANRLPSIIRVEIEPYHPLGESKAIALGRDYALSGMKFADEEAVRVWIEKIRSKTATEVKRG